MLLLLALWYRTRIPPWKFGRDQREISYAPLSAAAAVMVSFSILVYSKKGKVRHKKGSNRNKPSFVFTNTNAAAAFAL